MVFSSSSRSLDAVRLALASVAACTMTLGLIGIGNDSTFREQLDSKVQSFLCETEISFPHTGPYSLIDNAESLIVTTRQFAFRSIL